MTLRFGSGRLPFELVLEGAKESAFGEPDGAELGRAGAFALVTRQNPVTAIVAINHMYALGAYAGVRAAVLRAPLRIEFLPERRPASAQPASGLMRGSTAPPRVATPAMAQPSRARRRANGSSAATKDGNDG